MIFRAVVRRLGKQRAVHLVLDAGVEHARRPLRDPPLELGLRHVQSDEESRLPPGATEQRVGERYERPSCLRELERPDDPAAVVRMHARRRHWVELGEPGVRSGRTVLVVEPLPPLARTGRRCGRQLELGERGAKVEAGPAHDERRLSGLQDLVDCGVRERRVLAHRRHDARAARCPRVVPGAAIGS